MKQLLPILVLLGSCWAATPVVTQKTANSCGTGATCATASITTVTGRTVAVACQSASTSTTLSVSDGTNTYTAVGSANTTGTAPGSMRWFVAKNITGVTHVITCTSTQSSGFSWDAVYELSGASATAPVDVPTGAQASGTTGTSAAPSFTLPTTTFANDILLFAATCGATCSAGAGVDAGNSQSDGSGDEAETFSKSATGTYSGAFTQTSSTWGVVGVAITDGGGGAAAPSGFNKRQKIEQMER